MSVRKFKTFEEASKDLWNYFPDVEYYKRIANFYKLVSHISKPYIQYGVSKFKTIEEANKARTKDKCQNTK